jgi:hypothetical protein
LAAAAVSKSRRLCSSETPRRWARARRISTTRSYSWRMRI